MNNLIALRSIEATSKLIEDQFEKTKIVSGTNVVRTLLLKLTQELDTKARGDDMINEVGHCNFFLNDIDYNPGNDEIKFIYDVGVFKVHLRHNVCNGDLTAVDFVTIICPFNIAGSRTDMRRTFFSVKVRDIYQLFLDLVNMPLDTSADNKEISISRYISSLSSKYEVKLSE